MEPINWQKQLYLYCKLKGYSMSSTFKTYNDILQKVLGKFPRLEEAPLVQIQEYAAAIPNPNTRKNTLVVIRWAFDKVLHRPIDWRDLPYPKCKRKVQPIYTHEEVMKIYESIKNAKQRAIFGLIIDKGLRISEPCGILVADCNSKQGSIVLRSAKGGNDRTIYPSKEVWNLIRAYWSLWKKAPTDKYLFDGQMKGHPYTPVSIRAFIKTHCSLTNVPYKKVHSFRRYNITWGAEHGTPLSVLAEIAGHETTRTIERHYIIHSPTHLRGVLSPLTSARQTT